jgi:hypothetical protein
MLPYLEAGLEPGAEEGGLLLPHPGRLALVDAVPGLLVGEGALNVVWELSHPPS